jgi:hypothetical protein
MHRSASFLLSALAISSLLFACGFSKMEIDCSQFKTGNFLYHFRGQQGVFFFSISRNDSVQTEINQKTGDTTTLAVTWVDKCKYELQIIESTARFSDSIQKIRKSLILRNEIVNWTDKYYVFKSKEDNSDFVLTDTLWIK